MTAPRYTYVTGDVQGCLDALERLLARIDFNPHTDRMLFAGDLVNRGPDSLGVLRLIKQLGQAADTVLGNHDLHLLAVAHGTREAGSKDTLDAVLKAPDRDELIDWLQHKPLLIDLPHHNAVLTHAGIPPLWSLKKARRRAREVEHALADDAQAHDFFNTMYGNKPAGWSKQLDGTTRLRVITNYFTRMRFVNLAGELDLGMKGSATQAPNGFFPWFSHPKRKVTECRVLFGHWAALEGVTHTPQVEALDTGCVWGGSLTTLRLEDNRRFQVHSRHS